MNLFDKRMLRLWRHSSVWISGLFGAPGGLLELLTVIRPTLYLLQMSLSGVDTPEADELIDSIPSKMAEAPWFYNGTLEKGLKVSDRGISRSCWSLAALFFPGVPFCTLSL